jgi:hypothetical protein
VSVEAALATVREDLLGHRKLARQLFQMIPREVWRDHGGDDGQGHYEGEYHAEQIEQSLVGDDLPSVAALDAIASELERQRRECEMLTAEKSGQNEITRREIDRAEAAEAELERVRERLDAEQKEHGETLAELERVRAERDGAELMLRDVRRDLQAHLDRAVGALREIAGPFGAEWPDAQDRARAALAEIEESDVPR